MKKYRCVIVDDEALAIDRLKGLLNVVGNVEVCYSDTNPLIAVEKIVLVKPDVVLVDVEMPGLTGFQLVNEVRSHLIFPHFVFVTAYSQYAIKAIKAQAFDYLLKPVDIDDLRESICRFESLHKPLSFPCESMLSSREQEILALVAQGKTSQEIANTLFLSKHTVDTHRRKIIEKMGVKSLAQGVARARGDF